MINGIEDMNKVNGHTIESGEVENSMIVKEDDRKDDGLSCSDVIRETAQKQFSLGYQEPEASDLASERMTNTDYVQDHAADYSHSRNQFHSQRNSADAHDIDDDHIKITIELGEGLHEDIIVKPGQENCAPQYSAQFCLKHGYDKAVENALTDRIKENIDKIKD